MTYWIECDWCRRHLSSTSDDYATLDVKIYRVGSALGETRQKRHLCVTPQDDRNRMGLVNDTDCPEEDRSSCYGKALAAITGTRLAPPDLGMRWVLAPDPDAPATAAPVDDAPSRSGSPPVLDPRLRAFMNRVGPRSRLALPRAGIHSLEQAERMSDDELLLLPGVGIGTVRALREFGVREEARTMVSRLAGDVLVEELELNVRAYNAIKKAGISTAGQLAARVSDGTVGDIPGVGKDSVQSIELALDKLAADVATERRAGRATA